MARITGLARTWDARVDSWQHHVGADHTFAEIREAVCAAAAPGTLDTVVDLGAGAGFLTLPLAKLASRVIAVDSAPAMLQALSVAASRAELDNIERVTADLALFDLPPQSVDIIVSSYALHHLTDEQKMALLRRAYRWLRPGGKVIIADMMFGRGLDARDRSILRRKVAALVRRGPSGWWRIAKNVVRFGLRIGSERPATPAFWVSAAQSTGFSAVTFADIRMEAGLLTAQASS